jgi:gluconolactonase
MDPGERRSSSAKESNGANGNTFDLQGRLYTCESVTRQVTRTGAGGSRVLANEWEGKRLNALTTSW